MRSIDYQIVPRLRDADGAVCLDCGQVWTALSRPWHFSKSKAMHSAGLCHRVRYFQFKSAPVAAFGPRARLKDPVEHPSLPLRRGASARCDITEGHGSPHGAPPEA